MVRFIEEENPGAGLQWGGEFHDGAYRMVSAQANYQNMVWKRHEGKGGTVWLTSSDGLANRIIYHNPRDHNSQGFGGAELTFQLEDGSSIKMKGPWGSNAEALFDATGVDLRDKFTTWGCVGRWRTYDHGSSVVGGLIYFDKEPTVGKFDRIELIAKELSYNRQELLVCYSSSVGGSSCGFVNPLDLHRRRGTFMTETERAQMALYWEHYYQMYPHLDMRKDTQLYFKPGPKKDEEQAHNLSDRGRGQEYL